MNFTFQPIRRLLTAGLAATMLFNAGQGAFAQSAVDDSDAAYGHAVYMPLVAKTKQLSGAYHYPVQPGSEAWAQFETHEQMQAATQIPSETLAQLSTEALVETVLRYPLFSDMLAYNNLQQGFETVAAGFNGLTELIERPDAGDQLLARYEAMEPTTVVGASLEQQGAYDQQFTFVEMLLAQPQIQDDLNEAENKALVAEAFEKFEGKQQLAEIYGHFGRERSALVMGRAVAHTLAGAADTQATDVHSFLTDANFATTEVLSAILEQTKGYLGLPDDVAALVSAAATNDYYGTVYTPRGTRVQVIVMTYEMTAAQMASTHTQVAVQYPRATRVSNASRRYNCHSYAWYYANPANTAWMNSPNDDLYWRDGSYVRVATSYSGSMAPAAPIYARVEYVYGDHSAVKYTSTTFISKWGQWPVMIHAPGYSPYTASVLNYYSR